MQFGIVVAKRKIKVGEVVGSWCKSRGGNMSARGASSARGARGEHELQRLTRKEFKDEVGRLDVKLAGKPATRKALGALFDSVDTDKSGSLDVEEAKAALKKWQAKAVESYAELEEKKKEVKRAKVYAARQCVFAHHDRSSISLPCLLLAYLRCLPA